MKQEDETNEMKLRVKLRRIAERQKHLLDIEAQMQHLKADIDEHISKFADKVNELQKTVRDDLAK